MYESDAGLAEISLVVENKVTRSPKILKRYLSFIFGPKCDSPLLSQICRTNSAFTAASREGEEFVFAGMFWLGLQWE